MGELTLRKLSHPSHRITEALRWMIALKGAASQCLSVFIDHVPAWICRQCGEALFEEETVEAIQAMLREVDRQAEALALAAT